MTDLLSAVAADPQWANVPPAVATCALRETVAELRARLTSSATAKDAAVTSVADLIRAAWARIATRRARRLSRVINATGIALHTGLGRSVLPREAIDRIACVAAGYCSLEIDIESGERGLRGGYVEELLRELTGAEAALVVNNNAAATVLTIRAIAHGREVVVSRGQLIEIGGSYRLPDVMSAGGVTLREVGTTNKTHLRDYESAINERTAMLMHVHTSNYRVVGFSECPAIADLAKLAHRRKLPLFDDLGSGALNDDAIWAEAQEPTAAASLRCGADIVAFSGDKLLGGPQAGILLGRRRFIERLRRDPMARALRVGKLTLAALEAVLELYHDQAVARRRIPLLAMLSESMESLTNRAENLARSLMEVVPGDSVEVREDSSYAGGGSLPAWPLRTMTVRWKPARAGIDATARALRVGEPSILARVKRGAILFDVRTLGEEECSEIVACIRRLQAGGS
ncbi:MAG: L-seryl-tRNA(Sec) selenium transferase [Phycisphaerae bacterium]|nr:L-seryl-tRNA(Sec) selenium transferase [Phycisphaerae bacterium]